MAVNGFCIWFLLVLTMVIIFSEVRSRLSRQLRQRSCRSPRGRDGRPPRPDPPALGDGLAACHHQRGDAVLSHLFGGAPGRLSRADSKYLDAVGTQKALNGHDRWPQVGVSFLFATVT